MASFDIYLQAIIFFTVILSAGFLWITRKILFAFPEGEDGLTIVSVAAQSSLLRWPSHVQRPENLGMYMKGMTILLLVLFQKIFRDKKSVVPLVALWGTANAISAVLIFLIGTSYFNPLIGLIVSLLFITSFWPWQTALTMGHINIATTVFLAGVYSTTHIVTETGNASPFWLILAGAFFACLFFSSSSAIKYFPLAFVSLLFTKYRIALETGGIPQAIRDVLVPHSEAMVVYVFMPLILAIIGLIIIFSYKRLVARMYVGNLPRWLVYVLSFFNLDMAGKSQFALEHYIKHARRKIYKAVSVWIFRIYLFGTFILYPLGLYFILLFLSGFVAMVLFWTLPNVKNGLSFYWHYIRENQIRQKTSFRCWVEYFAAKGIRVDRYFTPSSFVWLPRFFLKFIPGPILIFCASLFFLVISSLITHNGWGLTNTVLVLFVSLLPCIWGELTNSPKSGRIYLSAYLGFLLFIGYALQETGTVVFSRLSPLIFIILAGIFMWNMWKFFTDIFPSRMAVANLLKALDSRGIKEFYTYRTGYNMHLVGTIRPELIKKYTIHYIDNLTEVKDGWIVIPGTSLKTSFWTTDEMMSGADSIKDPIYKKLLETKEIERISAVKFKTFNSSPLWIMEHEVSSFQDLVLDAITAKDFFQGHAWLLHSRELANI